MAASSADTRPTAHPAARRPVPAAAGAAKLDAIDAIRGWAIFLVITAHTGGLFPELPWPLKKITNFGWYGVQLFFVASAFTLMLSWERMGPDKVRNTVNFFLRRLFRIAPAYYLGALLYFFIRPPGASFDLSQLFATLLFVNAWSPEWLTTMDGRWQVIPGSWSISVEFAFYAIFPLLALVATSTRRLLLITLGAFVLMQLSPSLGPGTAATNLSETARDNFLFFWPPNQLVIFCLGLILFHVVRSEDRWCQAIRAHVSAHPAVWLCICAAALLALTQFGGRKTSETTDWLYPLPTHVAVSLLFMGLCAALILAPGRFAWLTGKLWRRLGEASFAAYVVHWSMLDLAHLLMARTGLHSVGWAAIAHFFVALLLLAGSTFAVSTVIHHLVEKPMVRLGRRLEWTS
jgi:peptidoglycan/LPS O-acetylase OafA/YrhL